MKRALKERRAERRAAESKIIKALLESHRYVVSDSLKKNERNTVAFNFSAPPGQSAIDAVCVKLIVPTSSWLGREITKQRAERDPRTSTSKKLRDKARAKSRSSNGEPGNGD